MNNLTIFNRNRNFRILCRFALTFALIIVPIKTFGYVEISGPTVVVGGGSADYECVITCDNWDACYGYIYDWEVTGGTITSENSGECTVDWDLSGGTHRLTGYFCYNYMYSGNWYTDYGSLQVNVSTTYTYIKTTVSNYSIDSSDIAGYNYIHTISPVSEYASLPFCRETRSADLNESFQLIDGLGRPYHSMNLRSAYNGDDLYQFYEFDDYGREAVKYIPIPHSRVSNILYLSDLKTRTLNYYGSSNYPYSETVFDGSPMNRVLEQGAVGADWQPTDQSGSSNGHTQKIEYHSNEATEITVFGK